MSQEVEISLAPMMDVTTAHFRRFIRLTSEKTVLFTEMIVSNTVIHVPRGKLRERLGEYDDRTVVQIGGSDATSMVEAVKILQGLGYRMFNLNCGCPSSRVKKGSFGAVLMLNRELVAEIINRVYGETGAVLSLKIRTGVDEHDGVDFLDGFVSHIKKNTPTRTFYVHARRCWLEGLSPQQNRKAPPLDYASVYAIKSLHPELRIILNGSIGEGNLDKIHNLDGVMIGRGAIRNVFVFWDIENRMSMCGAERRCKDGRECQPDTGIQKIECSDVEDHKSRRARKVLSVVKEYFDWFSPSEQLKPIHVQPVLNLMVAKRGCKAYRRRLNELVVGKAGPGEVYLLVAEFLGR
ncbi:tRNA-dihydrouridine synthase [Encephalitozoon cuniculi EcunIII-L]|nr:tRNA-dihydrouridine synthase [Encephalitozoon cuniculi EcunIII-L]UYI27281.1 tRNA-dihydrouridine synthase [Encephalitozoon cuniculi]